MDYIKFKVLGKSMITLDMLIDNKSKIVNFCNVLYISKLEYNLFSVDIIEKAGYSILAKKRKMIIFDNKDNIAFEAIKIRISYLVNVLISKKTLALAFLYLVLYNNAS